MWGALLIAFGVAGHIKHNHQQKPGIVWLLWVITMLMLWLAILLRHNAVFATIPLAGFAIFRLYPKDTIWGLIRVAIPAAMIAAALFAVSGNINKQLSARHTQPWVANASFDIVGVIKRLEDKTAQQVLFNQLSGLLNSTGAIEPLLKSYTPMYWREIFRSKPPSLLLPEKAIGAQIHGFENFSEDQLNALHTLWTQSILSEPVLWLRHRWAVSKYILGLAPDSTWSPVIMGIETPLDLEPDYGKFTPSTFLQSKIEVGLNSLINDWYFQPWPYFIMSIAMLITVLFRSVTINIEVICLTFSGLLHEFGLLLAAPSPDFRYSHYMIFCTLLSLLLLVRTSTKRFGRPKINNCTLKYVASSKPTLTANA